MNFLCNNLKFLISHANYMCNPDKKQQKLSLFPTIQQKSRLTSSFICFILMKKSVKEVHFLYVYTNDLLISRMNDYDLFFGESGYVHTDDTWHSEKVCSPYSRIYFVESGLAHLKTACGDVFLEPGNVYLIPTGLLYDFEGSPSVQKLFFHINLFKPDGFDLMLSCKQIASLPYSEKQTEELHKLYESDRFADMVLLKGRIAGVLSDMIEAYKIGFDDNDHYTPLVQNAMKYIRANLSVKLNISQVAEHGFVSVSTLTKAFKEQTGRTVGLYIDDLVMYSAQRKLLCTDLSVNEISEAFGFCDQFYFSRYFKRRCGELPLRYRKRMQTVDFGAEPNITKVKI